MARAIRKSAEGIRHRERAEAAAAAPRPVVSRRLVLPCDVPPVPGLAVNPHGWRLSDLATHPTNGVRVFSTFAGGGGSSLGYKRAGCDVIGANDIDPEQAWHYQTNLRPAHYFLQPINELLVGPIPDALRDLDILDGSPPCSTFSMSGNREADWGKDKQFREGQAEQVLSDLFFDFLALAERLRPRVVIAENVKGMLLGNAKGYVRAIVKRLQEAGYRTQVTLLDAASCGVPQRRERVFFTAVREDWSNRRLVIVPPRDGSPERPLVTVREAFADLELTEDERDMTLPRPNDVKCWPKTRPGESYAQMKHRMGITPITNFNHFKLHPDELAPTQTANSHTTTHWSEPRLLTAREALRMGSFPDDYISREWNSAYYVCGMSVPPKLTEVVARAVCEQWFPDGPPARTP